MGLGHKNGVLRIVFSLCGCLLIAGFTWGQEVGASADTVSEDAVPSDTGRAAESQIVFMYDNENAAEADDAAGTNSSYGLWFFVRTVLVLGIVLALVWVFFMFLKKASGTTASSDSYLKKVASLTLAPGKFVYVVTLSSQAYIVGVADNGVNLIGEVHDKELVDAMNLNAPQDFEAKGTIDFSALLGKFKTSGKKGASMGTGGNFSTSSLVEQLQSQRSRLNVQDSGRDGDVSP